MVKSISESDPSSDSPLSLNTSSYVTEWNGREVKLQPPLHSNAILWKDVQDIIEDSKSALESLSAEEGRQFALKQAEDPSQLSEDDDDFFFELPKNPQIKPVIPSTPLESELAEIRSQAEKYPYLVYSKDQIENLRGKICIQNIYFQGRIIENFGRHIPHASMEKILKAFGIVGGIKEGVSVSCIKSILISAGVADHLIEAYAQNIAYLANPLRSSLEKLEKMEIENRKASIARCSKQDLSQSLTEPKQELDVQTKQRFNGIDPSVEITTKAEEHSSKATKILVEAILHSMASGIAIEILPLALLEGTLAVQAWKDWAKEYMQALEAEKKEKEASCD